MTLIDFLLLLVVAAIIGAIGEAIGEAIGGYSPSGCAMSVVVGFVGALIGRYLRTFFHMPTFFSVSVGGTKFPIIWSVIGAALLVAVVRLIQKPARRGLNADLNAA